MKKGPPKYPECEKTIDLSNMIPASSQPIIHPVINRGKLCWKFDKISLLPLQVQNGYMNTRFDPARFHENEYQQIHERAVREGNLFKALLDVLSTVVRPLRWWEIKQVSVFNIVY